MGNSDCPSLGHLGDHLSLGWLLHQVSPGVRPSEKLGVFCFVNAYRVIAPLNCKDDIL